MPIMLPNRSTCNEHVAKQLASLWNCEEDSDCVVVFCVKASSLQDLPAATTGEPLFKRQRLADGSISVYGIRGDSIVVGDPLPGHQLVLRFASERLAAQLKRWDTRKSRTAIGPSELGAALPATVDGRPVLRVHLAHEAEEPSARMAIRYAYTGDVQARCIREALDVRRQAVNLRIEGCAAACMDIVKAKLAEASSCSITSSETAAPPITHCNSSSSDSAETPPVLELYFCEPLWPDPAQEPDFAAVLASAKHGLVAHFGDVLRTLNTRQLRQQLLKLPAVAVEALLESDDFGADSESSVLLMLAIWIEANCASTDARTRERLCRQVRLIQLSRPYLCSILPVLALDFETGGTGGGTATQPASTTAAPVAASVTASSSAAANPTCFALAPAVAGHITITATPTGTIAASTSGSAAATTLNTVVAAGWFPIRGTEAAYICSLATAQPPMREALVTAGRKLYDMQCPWYCMRRRRQCLPATGLVYHWRITAQELSAALTGLEPGGLCCTAGSFDGNFNFIAAGGFEWWPSIEYRKGATDANLGLYSQLPEAFQVPGSRFMGPRPPVVTVAGLDADLSVHHWQHESLVDDGVYFSTSKDIWPVGGGRGANVLALRPAPPTASATDGAAGPLAAWSDYLRDGEMAGTLTLLPPSPIP